MTTSTDTGYAELARALHDHVDGEMRFDGGSRAAYSTGAKAERLDSGCCGLAGNFGFQLGHLADGFRCRTQIHELDSGGREAMHLAELLAVGSALPAEHQSERPHGLLRPAGRPRERYPGWPQPGSRSLWLERAPERADSDADCHLA